MARKMLGASTAMIVLAVIVVGTLAESNDCTAALVSLTPCLEYITGRSSAPSTPCCSQLATSAQTEPQCLCAVLNGGASQFGITINQTLALALPGACNVQTPPVSNCNGAGGPSMPVTPGGGNGNSGDSVGSFLQPMSTPVVFSIVVLSMAYISMPSTVLYLMSS